MNRPTVLFCRAVLLLDRIPAYRRFYTFETVEDMETFLHRQQKPKPTWRWEWHGLWGFYLLDNLGLLGRYIEHCNPGIDDWLAEWKVDEENE